MTISTWHSFTVQDFFRRINWQGHGLIEQSQEDSRNLPWHTQTVAEFFALGLWLETALGDKSSGQKVFSWSDSLGDCLQAFSWHRPFSGGAQSMTETPQAELQTSTQQFNLQDLSDLF
ncbi:hypothetical protein [Lyngbya confervoides]|uniref:Uncharacterized protein n=1 Tax=Lyngbya confervoides BDU141951 TaxID=1574623 RepID=A0ABD4T5R6_9CYAN|nr:hypothetical protein [Lyngbya confervoides]MCM1983820.1 hypothetical protein [Lyngbya confervoides BDU141951]